MKDKIEKLNINGKIYVWKYIENSRNYPGWNFTADKKASESFTELFRLMQSCAWSSKKEIKTTIPTEIQIKIPNNRNGIAKWKSVSKLSICLKKIDDKNFWKIMEKEDEVEIHFGENKIVELETAINRISKGNGDFAISNNLEEDILYFW